MSLKSINLFSALVLLMHPLLVHSETNIAKLKGNFEEKYSEEVPVSGNIIAGLMISGQADKLFDFAPHIHTAKNINSHDVCISIISKDGVYSSSNTFSLPSSSKSEFISVDYSATKYKDYLNTIQQDNVTIKTRYGACGKNSNSAYLISTNSNHNIKGTKLNIYIDSLGATDVFVAARTMDKKIVKGNCAAITGERKTGYDHICSFDLSKFTPEEFDVQVVRKRFGRNMQSLKFKVAM